MKPPQIKTNEIKYHCGLCDTQSESEMDYLSHISTVHRRKNAPKNTKQHQCEFCDLCFAKKKRLNEHVAEVHEEYKRKKVQCSICWKNFCELKVLKIHILTVHEGKRQFECSTCGKTFTQSGLWLGIYHQFMKGKNHFNAVFATLHLQKIQDCRNILGHVMEEKSL